VSLVEDLNLWMPFMVMYSIHVLIGLFRTNQTVFSRMMNNVTKLGAGVHILLKLS
jgi:hypothetical protein